MSLGLNQSLLSAGSNKLLPAFKKLTSWITGSTKDGNTLANNRGIDAELTGMNCLSFDSGGDDYVTFPSSMDFEVSKQYSVTLTFDPTAVSDTTFFASSTSSISRFAIGMASGDATKLVVTVREGTSETVETPFPSGVITLTANFNPGVQPRLTASYVDSNGSTTNFTTIDSTGVTSGTVKTVLNARSNLQSEATAKYSLLTVTKDNTVVGKYPLAEGSGTKAYDVSGNGNHGVISNPTWTTADDMEAWNNEYGYNLASSVKVPSLGAITKQVATFDGSADRVDFASSLLNSASTFTVRFDIHKYERTGGNFAWVVGGLAGANFGLNKGGSVMFYRAADNTYLEFDGTGNTTTTANLDLDGKSIVVKGSNDVIELFIDTVSYGTVTAPTGQGLYTASKYGQGYVNATHNFKGSLSRVALWNTANDGQDLSTALVNHEFQSDIGTNTIQDTTANNNDGTVAVGSGGTATFWGKRVADTAGSIVSADYAAGNLTLSNLGGFIHNGSECGIKLKSANKLKAFSGVTGVAFAPVQLIAGTYDFEMEITITHRSDHSDYKSFFGGWNVGGTNGAVTIHSAPNQVYLIAKATDGTVVAGSSNAKLTINTADFLSVRGIPTTYLIKREGNTLKGFRDGVEKFSRDCTGKSFGNTFINHYPIGYNGTSGTPNNSVFGNTIGNITYHRVRYTENTTRDFEYDFSEASGTTLTDLSGNGNHGTISSGSEGLVSRWSDSYQQYPSVLNTYSFIPSSITVTGASTADANTTYFFSGYGELVSGNAVGWIAPNDYYIAFDEGGPTWGIYDDGGNDVSTNAGSTLIPPEGSWSNSATVTHSKQGLFINKSGTNIVQLGQCDEDEDLTATEEILNERYFGTT